MAIADERDDGDARLALAAVATRLRVRGGSGRRVVLADGEPRVVLVDERLAVEPERLGVRAQEAADVVGAGRMSNCSSSRARRYFGRIFVRSSSSGKSRLLAEAGLAEAGADVEHAGRSVEARRSVAAGADVLEKPVDAERDERRGREAEADRSEHVPRRGRRPGAPRPSDTAVRRRARRASESETSARPAATGIAKPACRRSYVSLKRVR